jgi:hypothetical protein
MLVVVRRDGNARATHRIAPTTITKPYKPWNAP